MTTYKIHLGDNRDILRTLPDNSIDAVVTDPPYGINFLNNKWDADTGALETYAECLRVLKPGGHILAFSAPRTYHYLAITLEQAGFEIRDQIMWLFSAGFPKSQDIGKSIERREGKRKPINTVELRQDYGIIPSGYCTICDKLERYSSYKSCQVEECPYRDRKRPADNEWSGWKTTLKPAHEPIVMARKPFTGSTVDNVLEWGTGALNIDDSRVPFSADDNLESTYTNTTDWTNAVTQSQDRGPLSNRPAFPSDKGRYPSNIIGEVPGHQKFFYCPKITRHERHIGFDLDDIPICDHEQGVAHRRPEQGNNHPTVKPVALMRYLIRLVTPPGGTVLDPFCGSGSTGMAAVELGHDFIGCELDENYVRIAETRIAAWQEEIQPKNNFNDLFDLD